MGTGVSEDIQITSPDKSISIVEKDHNAVAETNKAVSKSNPITTVDLTESSSTDSPPAKKLKTLI